MCPKCHGLSSAAGPSNSTTFEVAYISPDTVARAGDDVFLGCTFKAATSPGYQWMYRGLNGANATHLLETTSGLLELRAVKLEDAGMYECVASINDGERPLRQSVLLTVKGKLIPKASVCVCVCSSPHTVRHCTNSSSPGIVCQYCLFMSPCVVITIECCPTMVHTKTTYVQYVYCAICAGCDSMLQPIVRNLCQVI